MKQNNDTLTELVLDAVQVVRDTYIPGVSESGLLMSPVTAVVLQALIDRKDSETPDR